MMRSIIFVGMLLAWSGPGAAASPKDAEDALVSSALDLFHLGNECKPVGLLVERLPTGAATRGLKREDIVTMVRSRLRAARLYRDHTFGPHLYVNVNVLSAAHSIRFDFNKMLNDPISGQSMLAVTWDKSLLGQDGDVHFILGGVSQLTDEFIDAYLRVNEEACQRRK